MLKSLTLRVKLILAFLALALLLAGVSYYQINSIQSLNSLFSNLVSEDFARVNALEGIELSVARLRDQRTEYMQAITTTPASKLTSQKTDVIAQANDLQNKIQLYQSLAKIDSPNVGQQTVNTIVSAGNDVVRISLLVINNANTTANQANLRAAQTQLDQTITAASSAEKAGIMHESDAIAATAKRLLWTIVGLAIMVMLLAMILGAGMSSWIVRSLTALRLGAERIANGDFSQATTITGKDEIGQLAATFNHMAERLKDSYRRLALERQRDEAILEAMNEGLIATDETAKIVLVNKMATQLLGLPSEEAVAGQAITDAYELHEVTEKKGQPGPLLPPEQRPTRLALATGEITSGVFGFQAKDGSERQLNISASPVKLEGTVVGSVTIIRDVTKEKEIDRMKTEFISLASHQLRTPLSAIRWFSEMLVAGDAGKLKPEQLDFAQNISSSTERMIALVNALLNISRIESGRIMIAPQPTDLRELVSGIIVDLKGKTEEKHQNLIISVHEGLPKINVDPRLIGQVYLNLLTNAIKYTPKGGEISVFISKKGNDVISQVTDNGYGIPKEQQGRIFEKFFRAANAVKVETDGTGLGLYLIKAVVESSGGKIWFESKENKGTTFWFSIPLSGMKPKEGEVTLDA